jgi:septal ring factor EnvC (AmiA/AmiB activator)
LANESASLQTTLNGLTAQKNTIQAQVNLSQAKYDKLVTEIKATEKKLLQSQDVLTSIISTMVAESQESPIEILASSSTVGDSIIAMERLGSVQNQLQGSITEIADLKATLTEQKDAAEAVLKDQKAQRDALAAKENEQAQLLAATQG